MKVINKYTEEHIDFLVRICPGLSYKKIAAKMMKKFPDLDMNVKKVSSLMKRFKLVNGRNTQFKKGDISHNKGKKGWCPPGCEKGWFKKGHLPKNHLPVGTKLLKSDGYVYIKIADPNKWKTKHRLLWEEKNGPYNSNTHVLIFKDQDRHNIQLDNLELITRRQLAILNKNHLIQDDKALTETGLIVGQLMEKIARRTKDGKQTIRSK